MLHYLAYCDVREVEVKTFTLGCDLSRRRGVFVAYGVLLNRVLGVRTWIHFVLILNVEPRRRPSEEILNEDLLRFFRNQESKKFINFVAMPSVARQRDDVPAQQGTQAVIIFFFPLPSYVRVKILKSPDSLIVAIEKLPVSR